MTPRPTQVYSDGGVAAAVGAIWWFAFAGLRYGISTSMSRASFTTSGGDA
jgi:hypothetical protein